MTDGQVLFLILALLHLSEGLVWVRRRSVLLAAPWNRGWRVRPAARLFGNARGGVGGLNPLPPFGTACICHFPPLSLAPEGLTALTPHGAPLGAGSPDRPTGLRWEEVREVRVESRDLVIGDRFRVECASPHEAATLKARITRVAALSPDRREAALRGDVANSFRTAECTARLAEVRRAARTVRDHGIAFWLSLYVVVPALALRFGVECLVLPGAALMLVFALIITWRFRRAHRALYPEARLDRGRELAKMILCPPTAIRAADLLLLPALEAFHPVTAAVALGGESGEAFLRSVARELGHPLRVDSADARSEAVLRWQTATELQRCREVVEAARPDGWKTLLAPPVPDGSSRGYCPRCETQLNRTEGECPDCPGVRVVPFLRDR